MMDKSTKDHVSDKPLAEANMEELKQQWTLEQLELSKRVSEVCHKSLVRLNNQFDIILLRLTIFWTVQQI